MEKSDKCMFIIISRSEDSDCAAENSALDALNVPNSFRRNIEF